jgi:Holliday junction resolvase RusA-like endonuclease
LKTLAFTLHISPTGQKRARSRAVTNGDRVFSMTYKDGKQRREEDKLVSLLLEHRPSALITGQIFLGVKAYVQIPASKPKRFKADALAGAIRPTTKPDLDNLIKQIKDVCTGIFWVDDRQVVGYLPGTGKYYGDRPRWEITIAWDG